MECSEFSGLGLKDLLSGFGVEGFDFFGFRAFSTWRILNKSKGGYPSHQKEPPKQGAYDYRTSLIGCFPVQK